jgi:hypothetical protein
MDQFGLDQYSEQLDMPWTGQILSKSYFQKPCNTIQPIICWAVVVSPLSLQLGAKDIFIRYVEVVKPTQHSKPDQIGIIFWDGSHRRYSTFSLDVGWDFADHSGRMNRFFESRFYAEEYAAFLRLIEPERSKIIFQIPPKGNFEKRSIDPTKEIDQQV